MFSGKARPPGERWFSLGAVEPEALARAALLARGPCPDRPLARHRTGRWTGFPRPAG